MAGPGADETEEARVKKLVALAFAAGAALILRRQQSRPTADVWRDATAGPRPAPPDRA